MKELTQPILEYYDKIKYNGFKWTATDITKRFLTKVFRYKDLTLIMFAARLNEMPLIDAKLDGVTCDFITLDKKNQILELNDWQLGEEKYKEYMNNGSKCYGAFLDNRLIAYTWIHYRKFDFPNFKYTLTFHNDDIYAGPDFVHPEFRGERLQPTLLTHVANHYCKKGFKIGYGSIMKNNIASQKGVKKAGPKPISEVRIIRFYKYIVYRKVKNYTM